MPPTAVDRQTPAGILLENGFKSLITLGNDPDISFWEIDNTPPGFTVGPPIDKTTQHNTTYRTKAPPQLKEVTDGSITAGYDPNVVTQIIQQLGVEQSITYLMPDGSEEVHFGYVQDFIRDPLSDGTLPTAKLTIVHTSCDPTSGAEAAFVFTNVPGT